MVYESVVIGAGPAGLSAALYLARFRRTVLVVHDGGSRALSIPKSHNVPGFDLGISGADLVRQMTSHAQQYGAHVAEAEITHAARSEGGFRLTQADGAAIDCRTLILATGLLTDHLQLDPDVLAQAIAAGTLRYCPICDGYEHSGQRIAVMGDAPKAAGEALFLRTYFSDVTVISTGNDRPGHALAEALKARGVGLIHGPLHAIVLTEGGISLQIGGVAAPLVFDVLYPAEVTRPRTALAACLGLAGDTDGMMPASAILGTDVPGVFAAGDIVDGLDQISVAMGHGAIAATRAHNWLREQDGQALPPVG
jgi:thioredoxin reductase (NADPH)